MTDLTAQRDNDYAFRTHNRLFGWVSKYRCARNTMHKKKKAHHKISASIQKKQTALAMGLGLFVGSYMRIP